MSMSSEFHFDGFTRRSWHLPEVANEAFSPEGLYLGHGPHPLRVAVLTAEEKPSTTKLKTIWTKYHGRAASPLLLVVPENGSVTVCGPTGEIPDVHEELDAKKARRVILMALEERNRHAAVQLLCRDLPELASKYSGLRNEGMFASHELENGVPGLDEWARACERGASIIGKEGRALIEALGFTVEQYNTTTHVLRHDGVASAIALFLQSKEAPGAVSQRFGGTTPIASALATADAEGRDFVFVVQGAIVRLYVAQGYRGVGRKGRTETYVEVNTSLLDEEVAGYLPLIFGADALASNGTFGKILERSQDYAVGVSKRLRERVYQDVVPQLAEVLAAKESLDGEDNLLELEQLYETAMKILFRLLFVAYGEDKNLLPYRTNQRYRHLSLKTLARDLAQRKNEATLQFDTDATSIWDGLQTLWRAIDKGDTDLGVPEYNGGLFAADAKTNATGHYIKNLSLTNAEIGPALFHLLVDETDEGVFGPVDFRSLSVREFGTVYEGLLESKLSRAPFDLTLNKKIEFVPAKKRDKVEVQEGEIFLQNQSGKRKETGTYFTKPLLVEHILDHALEPALDNHLERIENLLKENKVADAADAFFDFRCADIAMGSGHFLVAAVDRIEVRFSNFLAANSIPQVASELDNLQQAAQERLQLLADETEIDRASLLRRQIARRCVYGVDINSIAVELARLGIWIHTFVPGLPLSFLNHNLVQGDSLAGIGTIDEALQELGAGDDPSGIPLWKGQIYGELENAKDALDKLGRIADISAAQVKEAKEAHKESRESISAIADLFDLLSAARQKDHISHPTDIVAEAIQKNRYLSEAKQTARDQRAVHFPVAFPEVFLREQSGFDCILGNPPWEEATVERDKFWTQYFPGLVAKSEAEKKKLLAKFEEQRPDLLLEYSREVDKAEGVRSMLINGPYPGMGSGDPDLYKAFAWRFWALCRSKGFIGVVMPRSALITKGGREWRHKVVNNGHVRDATLIVNTGNWAFDDMEARYTIGLLSIEKTGSADPVNLRGPFMSEDQFQSGHLGQPVTFENTVFQSSTSNLAFPILGSQSESKVFKKLIESPRFDSDTHTWSCRPVAELHATNDKKHMVLDPKSTEGLWPVYKGASFNIWEPDTGERYAWADPEYITDMLYKKRKRQHRTSSSAFHHFPEPWIQDKTTLPCRHPRLAFRDVSRSTDTRTMICALLPPKRILTNKAPYLLFKTGDSKDEAYLLGVLSSIPLDWYARKVVEININFHILNAFPIPRADLGNKLRNRVEQIAGRLAASDQRFSTWAEEVGVEVGPVLEDQRAKMEAEVDALVAHLYGLSENDLKTIYETFHEGWDPTERMDQALEYYQAHA